jgi:hypothetical protein
MEDTSSCQQLLEYLVINMEMSKVGRTADFEVSQNVEEFVAIHLKVAKPIGVWVQLSDKQHMQ